MDIKDNTVLRQFETIFEGELHAVEYSLQEWKIFLTKLSIPENTPDEFAQEFLKEILEIIRERKLKVVPTAPKIVSFFRRNPSYKEMLPVGIVI
ncbi:MAG: N-acetyltransferase [Flavobacteriaceae bacterium]